MTLRHKSVVGPSRVVAEGRVGRDRQPQALRREGRRTFDARGEADGHRQTQYLWFGPSDWPKIFAGQSWAKRALYETISGWSCKVRAKSAQGSGQS